jgi:hypothetical protein
VFHHAAVGVAEIPKIADEIAAMPNRQLSTLRHKYKSGATEQGGRGPARQHSAPLRPVPEAPIHIEADRLVKVFRGAPTVILTPFHPGEFGFRNGGEWRAEQHPCGGEGVGSR